MKKTTFAVIGTGIVGERIIKQIQANENASIIALFDENKERLQEMSNTYGVPVASSYEEVLSMQPDWVYIGTPPNSHATLSQQAIEKGLSVLCEKPLAHDERDGLVMTEAVAQRNVMTAMHFPLMYSQSVRHMMKIVESGDIGDIVRVELSAYFPHWPRLWQQNPWIGTREQGGFIREVFPHYLQLMYRMFGPISVIHHETIYPKDQTLAETGVLAIAKTANGIPVLLNGISGIGQEENLIFTVYGTKGVLKLRNWSELSMSKKDSSFDILTFFEPVKTLVEECIAAKSEEASLIVPFAEGLIVQKIIDELLS